MRVGSFRVRDGRTHPSRPRNSLSSEHKAHRQPCCPQRIPEASTLKSGLLDSSRPAWAVHHMGATLAPLHLSVHLVRRAGCSCEGEITEHDEGADIWHTHQPQPLHSADVRHKALRVPQAQSPCSALPLRLWPVLPQRLASAGSALDQVPGSPHVNPRPGEPRLHPFQRLNLSLSVLYLFSASVQVKTALEQLSALFVPWDNRSTLMSEGPRLRESVPAC